MMVLLNSLNRDKLTELPLFVTLTYPDRFPRRSSEWKYHLDRFRKLLVARFGPFAGVWKMELQVRKSGINKGEIAPHFHLLLFLDVPAPELYELVSRLWDGVVASGDERHLKAGTRVEKVHSFNGVLSYAAKYMGKSETLSIGADGAREVGDPGRFWGVWSRGLLPVLVRDFALALEHGIKVRRHIRKCAGLRPSGVYSSMSAFISDSCILRLLDYYGAQAKEKPPDHSGGGSKSHNTGARLPSKGLGPDL